MGELIPSKGEIMKNLFLSVMAAAFAFAISTASARADAIGPALDPVDWTGPYMGITAGYGWGQSKHTDTFGTTTGDFDLHGGAIGLEGGYNWQFDSIVVGLEADGSLTTIDGTTTNLCKGGCTTKLRWLTTLRAKVGYPMGKFMPYVTGGMALGGVKATVSGTTSNEDTKFGWTAGGGLAYGFTTGFSAKVEYLYTDLDDVTVPTPAPVTAKANNFQLVRIGVDFAF